MAQECSGLSGLSPTPSRLSLPGLPFDQAMASFKGPPSGGLGLVLGVLGSGLKVGDVRLKAKARA